jgi:hypothetical protein
MASTVDIALLTGLVKDLRETETFAPAQVDMRNIRLSNAGNQVKRKGYVSWKDTTTEEPVISLIPENDGYALVRDGSIYTLGSSILNIHSGGAWANTPTWSKYNDKIIVASGGLPLLIDGNEVTGLGGNPPSGKFVENISSYTILSGYDETEFSWSQAGNPESWPDDNFANVQKTGTILNMVEYKDRLLFFKENETEVWNFVGGSSPFVRYPGGKIFKGLGANDSVVKANDRVYWFAHDGNFYVYEGGVAKVISDNMRRRLDDMSNLNDLKGFDITKENIIMWVNPTDGVTLLYDYSNNQWLEDARWDNGWQSLPFSSYMEFNRKQYFGSRNCDGLVHEWSEDHKDDNGQPIRSYRRFKVRLSQRDHTVRVDRLLLRREGAVATGTVASPVVAVRTRFDSGSWSRYHQLSLGAVGEHSAFKELRRRGVGRDFEVEIVATDNVDFVMTNAVVTFQELGR